MSRPAILIPPRGTSFSNCSAASPANKTPPRSWPLTAWRLQHWQTLWSACATAACRKSSTADMSRLLLFYRLMIRPLWGEPVRTALTVLAIALGVAVVLAIDLAGDAATGSFHSSLETLAGDNDLEIVATGGVPEQIAGVLATMPYAMRISPRIDDYAVLADSQRSVPLIGLDLVANAIDSSTQLSATGIATPQDALKYLGDY